MPSSFLRVQVQEAGKVGLDWEAAVHAYAPSPSGLASLQSSLPHLCCWWRLHASTWYSTPPALS
jgi:hypothetical protein